MSSRFESVTGVVDLEFPEYDDPPEEPMALARQWISEAVSGGVREPLALALATADAAGRPSTRMVAVIDVSARGLVFTTHAGSRKAREIAATGWASGLLYWRENTRQLSISGPVVALGTGENTLLWDRRPPALHAMSAASRQSEPLTDPEALLAEADSLAQQSPLPRPDRFVGFRLEPHSVEFWAAAETRLHRRLRYEHTGNGWRVTKLQP
jgi:dihydrophenazinedicarboxylate synthase